MSVSTHVLDASAGRPAAGVPVRLERATDQAQEVLTERSTDSDGRVADLAADLPAGVYRIVFDTGHYQGPGSFYPEVVVSFRITDPAAHHHIPLLLSPFAYSTYRGS